MNNYKKNIKHKTHQNGVALAVGIILLLIISVIGVNSMKSALLQEKMTGGLVNRNYADAAAYSLLVSVENYLNLIYVNNNGLEGLNCAPYCDDKPRSDQWHDFITKKNMVNGMVFPGANSHLTPLLPFIGEEPRFMVSLVPNANGGPLTGGEDSGTTENENDVYRITTKANDITGNYFVVYDSIYLMRAN